MEWSNTRCAGRPVGVADVLKLSSYEDVFEGIPLVSLQRRVSGAGTLLRQARRSSLRVERLQCPGTAPQRGLTLRPRWAMVRARLHGRRGRKDDLGGKAQGLGVQHPLESEGG